MKYVFAIQATMAHRSTEQATMAQYRAGNNTMTRAACLKGPPDLNNVLTPVTPGHSDDGICTAQLLGSSQLTVF